MFLSVVIKRKQGTTMGVLSLSSYLRKNCKGLARTVTLVHEQCAEHGVGADAGVPQRCILVDTNSFLIAFAAEINRRCGLWMKENCGEDAFPEANSVGGDLQAARSALVHAMTRMHEVYRVKMIFAVDAPRNLPINTAQRTSMFRERNDSKRALETEEIRTMLAQQAAQTTGVTPTTITTAARNDRGALMILLQLVATLKGLDVVTVMHLDDEVDRCIGALMHEYNPLCVFTADSDYVVTPGIPTVLDFAFPYEAMLFEWSPQASLLAAAPPQTRVSDAHLRERRQLPSQPTMVLRTLDSEAIAAHFKASETEFLLAMALRGNDTTREYMKAVDIFGVQRGELHNAVALAKEVLAQHQRDALTESGHLTCGGLMWDIFVDADNVEEVRKTAAYLVSVLRRIAMNPHDEAARRIDLNGAAWNAAALPFIDSSSNDDEEVTSKSHGPTFSLETWCCEWLLSTVEVGTTTPPAAGDEETARNSDTPTRTLVIGGQGFSRCGVNSIDVDVSGENAQRLAAVCNTAADALAVVQGASNEFVRLLSCVWCDDIDDRDMSEKDNERGTSKAADPDGPARAQTRRSPAIPSIIQSAIDEYMRNAERIPLVERCPVRPKVLLYHALLDQKLPVTCTLTLFSKRYQDHPIPMLDGAFECPLDLFTFYRLSQVVGHYFQVPSLNLRRDDSAHDPHPSLDQCSDWPSAVTLQKAAGAVEGTSNATRMLAPICLPAYVQELLPTWSPEPPQQEHTAQHKQAMLEAAFGMISGSAATLFTVDPSTPGRLPNSVILILWTMHAACTSQRDVQLIADMMTLTWFASEQRAGDGRTQKVARRVTSCLAKVTQAKEGTWDLRPPPQSLLGLKLTGLSRIFEAACGEVLRLLKLLKCDTLVRFPEPADVYSGTLLYDLARFDGPLTVEVIQQCATEATGAPAQPANGVCAEKTIEATARNIAATFESSFSQICFAVAREVKTVDCQV